jgi:hypothetical protein
MYYIFNIIYCIKITKHNTILKYITKNMTESTATEFKTQLTKALRKLDSDNIDIKTKKNVVKRPLTTYNIFMRESMKHVKIDNHDLIHKANH